MPLALRAKRPWGIADAAQAAENVVRFALGEVGVIAGREAEDALSRWCSIYGSEQWWEASQAVLAYSGTYWRSVGYFDPARDALKLNIARLNAWCECALTAFYAARGQGVPLPPVAHGDHQSDNPGIPATQTAGPAQTAEPAPEPTPSAAQRVRAPRTFDNAVAAMRKAIDEGKLTRDRLRVLRVDDLTAQFPGLGSRTVLYEARKKVLDEPA